ncbi:pterin-4-alpha-carbinolamine dehydratase [Chlorella sorokiniana]|jgi:4a-hydroxytetrahydrobiopterin dehydratase|uniref:4a-hydroxytetrahydrobiopterin dehydratase n=1 Tax=Chlorella sorokiniana TaxID=3076 RepID=A0A2P6U173_CHLSO|nr:pterin-4-alpha-carbinolamine dehydratase [Chlorella sorokiniana]|eukprot:PRW60065.1 pterin-4-alpha-carbinolamine dehydratase [Chlorella sorokiniana]
MQLAAPARLSQQLAALQRSVTAAQRRGVSAGRRGGLQICASINPNAERALMGEDFGARDPTAGELGSNFGDKVLGNYNTEHIIKPPDAMGEIVGLKNKKCVACEGGIEALSESEINRLQKQCAGWRLGKNAAGHDCISHEWKVRNFTAGLDLFQRIAVIAEEEGHHPDLHLTGYNTVVAEMTTHAAKGLTENDFIMAAKINEIEVSDLLPKRKPKFWA